VVFKIAQPDKNRPHDNELNSNNNQAGQDCPLKLYISSLHLNVSEETLRSIFEPFGKASFMCLAFILILSYLYDIYLIDQIDSVIIDKDDFHRSKGYGQIQFSNSEDGKKAMEQLNNHEIESYPIKISLSPEKTPDNAFMNMEKPHSNLNTDNNLEMMDTMHEGSNLELTAEPNFTPYSNENKTSGESPSNVIPSECILLSNMFDLIE
jgi:RNA recognition motif-containing protein